MKIKDGAIIIPPRQSAAPQTSVAGFPRRLYARNDGIWQVDTATGVHTRMTADLREPQAVWAMAMQYTGAGVWTTTLSSNQSYNFYSWNSLRAQNDKIACPMLFGQGLYLVTVLGATGGQAARADVTIDDEIIGTIDFYSAALTYNRNWQFRYDCTKYGNLEVAIKASSSSQPPPNVGYTIFITAIFITPVKENYDANIS